MRTRYIRVVGIDRSRPNLGFQKNVPGGGAWNITLLLILHMVVSVPS